MYEPNDSLDLPDWDQFSHNLNNKATLLEYLGNSWMKNRSHLQENLKVIVGGLLKDPGKTVEISNSGCKHLPEVSCK